MWIYLNYYRQICKKPKQIQILDEIEATAETKAFKNRSGEIILKHKATFMQFGFLNIGVTYEKKVANR